MATEHAERPVEPTNDLNTSAFKVSFTLPGGAVALLRQGLIGATEAMERMGFTIGRAARAARALPIPEVHSFRPDFDLRCTVEHCGLGPEEH